LTTKGVEGPNGGKWTADSVRYIVLNHCYIGKHLYNATMRVPNPKRPLGDITGAVKRTLIRPKPEGEAVVFNIPPLVSEELWLKANQAIRERGRGRGKEGKAIQALLRNRLFCPRCGKPMVVRRNTRDKKVYYFCSRLTHAFEGQHCTYRRFVPGVWDEVAWDCVYALLKDDIWVKARLFEVERQNEDIEKLIKLEHFKIVQNQAKIARIREGFEGGLYDLKEARSRVSSYQEIINKGEKEIERLSGMAGRQGSTVNIEQLKSDLQRLSQGNLDDATFAEKQGIMSKLGIRVYPSEDLKSMKVRCNLNFRNSASPDGCGIIKFGSLRSQ